MNKAKLGWYVASLLALMNIFLVATWIVMPHFNSVQPGDRPRKVVIERLNFNDAQIKAYDLLIADHSEEIRAGNDHILASKTALYTQLKSELNNQQVIDSLTNAIAANHKEIEQIHYQHFRQIKSLCEKQQLPLFDALVLDLAQIFNRKQPKR